MTTEKLSFTVRPTTSGVFVKIKETSENGRHIEESMLMTSMSEVQRWLEADDRRHQHPLQFHNMQKQIEDVFLAREQSTRDGRDG